MQDSKAKVGYLGWRADILEDVRSIGRAEGRKGPWVGPLEVKVDGSAVVIGCAGNALKMEGPPRTRILETTVDHISNCPSCLNTCAQKTPSLPQLSLLLC